MGVPLPVTLISAGILAYAFYKLLWQTERDREPSSHSHNENRYRRTREPESVPAAGHNHGARYRGFSSNNHDHMKRQYDTEEEAEEVIDRMRSQGADLNGTLTAYYNPDYGKWFVGNNRW